MFTLAEQVEFSGVVRPGELVRVAGRKVYFRGNQLKVDCVMTRSDGDEVCSGTLAGKGVPRDKFTGEKGRGHAPLVENGSLQEEGL